MISRTRKKINLGVLRDEIFFILQPILATVLGLGIGLFVTWLVGENPLNVLSILYRSAFGTWYDFGMTLFYCTALIFSGFSVMIPFHAGLFNVGAEGQLIVGALAAAVVGILFPQIPWPWAPLVATIAAFCGGALWAAIAGSLRAWRGCHEVITTIMLNFIAAGITNWITLYQFPNPSSQNPETSEVATSYMIHQFALFQGAPVSSALILALIIAVIVKVFLWSTRIGYEIRSCGQNERASQFAGIAVSKIQWLALALGGGMAGLVGVGEVLGNAGKFRIGFSPGIGFMGIAVALLGKNRPAGVIAAALLFGALHKGSMDLDFETEHISKELSLVFQALVILSVSASDIWNFLRKKEGK